MTDITSRPNNRLWFMPDDVKPGQPRRAVAQEFWNNVIGLGEYAREKYLEECKAGARDFNQAEIDDLDRNLAICRAELARFK